MRIEELLPYVDDMIKQYSGNNLEELHIDCEAIDEILDILKQAKLKVEFHSMRLRAIRSDKLLGK